jgi:hypothetical protein
MKNKKFIYTASFVAASLAAAHAQTTIADWDFDAGGAIAAPDNTPSATTGSGSATQLGMNNSYTFAGGEGPGSSAASDVLASGGASTDPTDSGSSFGWRIRGNSNAKNAGTGMANGWNSAAPIGTQGAEFSVNTSLFSSISLTFDLNATGQAERNLAVLYTLDDTQVTINWVNATITSPGTGGGVLANNTTSANTVIGNYVQLSGAGTGWNNQITATFVAGAADDANFAFEIVNASTGADDVNTSGVALNNSSGNWRYDNVLLSGLAVPEPGTLALAGLGGLASLITLRKSRKV